MKKESEIPENNNKTKSEQFLSPEKMIPAENTEKELNFTPQFTLLPLKIDNKPEEKIKFPIFQKLVPFYRPTHEKNEVFNFENVKVITPKNSELHKNIFTKNVESSEVETILNEKEKLKTCLLRSPFSKKEKDEFVKLARKCDRSFDTEPNKCDDSGNIYCLKNLYEKPFFKTLDSKERPNNLLTVSTTAMSKTNQKNLYQKNYNNSDFKQGSKIKQHQRFVSLHHSSTTEKNPSYERSIRESPSLAVENHQNMKELSEKDPEEVSGKLSKSQLGNSFDPALKNDSFQNSFKASCLIKQNESRNTRNSFFNRKHLLTTDASLLKNEQNLKNFNVDRKSIYLFLNNDIFSKSENLLNFYNNEFYFYKSEEYKSEHRVCKEILKKYCKRPPPSSSHGGYSSPSSTEKELQSVMNPSNCIAESKVGRNSGESNFQNGSVEQNLNNFQLQIHKVMEESIKDSHLKFSSPFLKNSTTRSPLKDPVLAGRCLSSDKTASKEDQSSNERDFENNFIKIFENKNYEMKLAGLQKSVSSQSIDDNFQIKIARHFHHEITNHLAPDFVLAKDNYSELLLLLDFFANDICVISFSDVRLIKKLYFQENALLLAILEVYRTFGLIIRKCPRNYGKLTDFDRRKQIS